MPTKLWTPAFAGVTIGGAARPGRWCGRLLEGAFSLDFVVSMAAGGSDLSACLPRHSPRIMSEKAPVL